MPTVVKVGGSLLANPEWPSVIEDWIRKDADSRYLLIVGGGNSINAIRELDRAHCSRIDQAFLHWLCVDILDSTFQIASQLFQIATPVSAQSQLRESLRRPLPKLPDQEVFLIRVGAFYFQEGHQHLQRTNNQILPENWETTTDSIAALLCHQAQISRLVIWKSIDVAANLPLSDLATKEVVDRAFPAIASNLNVEFRSLARG